MRADDDRGMPRPRPLEAPGQLTPERPERNSRLTALTGSVLLLFLLAQIATWLLGVRQHLSWHVFFGVSASVLVTLKATSTVYRFTRYYTHDRDYVAAGRPAPLMRVASPAFLVASVLLLGTGLLLITLGPQNAGVFRGLHGLLFWPWLALFAVHLIVYLPRLPGLLRRSRARDRAPRGRRSLAPHAAVLATLIVAVAVGALTHTFGARGPTTTATDRTAGTSACPRRSATEVPGNRTSRL